MDGLVELDKLSMVVVVDNESDGLSQPCKAADPSQKAADRAAKYQSELSHNVSNVRGGRADCLDFQSIAYAGHGLSVLLQAEVDGLPPRLLLFDGGPSRALFRHNAQSLGVPVGDIEAAVLSHWHIDHSIGLEEAAHMIAEARAAAAGSSSITGTEAGAGGGGSEGGEPATPRPAAIFDLHPKRPHRRGLKLTDGDIVPFNPEPELSQLERVGVEVQLHDEGHTLLDGCFYVSGAIPRHTSYEAGNPAHVSQMDVLCKEFYLFYLSSLGYVVAQLSKDPSLRITKQTPDGEWELDERVDDERYLAAAVKGKGIVVLSACSHAGIVNVMKDVQAKTGKAPFAVFGGFHLSPKDTAARIAPTIADIVSMQPELVVAGHCTGWQAKAALSAALQDRYMPSFVGARLSFPAAQDGTERAARRNEEKAVFRQSFGAPAPDDDPAKAERSRRAIAAVEELLREQAVE